MQLLRDKTVLIAGAGRNNGKAIALTFAREGADLILVARKRGDALNEVAKECESSGVQVLPLLADVSNPEAVNHMVQLGLDRFGKVDVLVSVTAIRPRHNFWDISYEEWLQVFAVNLHSTFYLAKAGLIKSLALELGPYNIRANLLAPYLIENVRLNPEWNPEGGSGPPTDAEIAGIPLGREGKPQEVANCALFLASDMSSFVTGDRVICSGGRYM
jgi:NAD(P)-dependent dehydrogenase (short-subunit alcohol dehydrogenase family)